MSNQPWPEVPLHELTTHIKDGTHGTHARVAEGVPLLSAKNIAENGRLLVSAADERISDTEYRAITSTFKPERGDLLLTIVGSIGRVALFDGRRVAFQRSVAFLRPGPAVHGRYLYHAATAGGFQRQLLRRANSTAQAGLYLGELASITVRLPSPPEQRAVAQVLSTLDDAIEHTEALIAKHQQIKAGLMYDLFTRGLTPEGQLRSSSETIRIRFGAMPSRWRLGSLADVADRTRQPILTGPFGADLGNDDFVNEGVPVLRIGNVQKGYLDLTDLLYVTESKAQQLERYRIHAGDLLFARQGATTGRNALATHSVRDSLINYHIIRVALDHRRCSPAFMQAAFEGEIVSRQIERDKGRGTREGINTRQLAELQIPLPSREEQDTIARLLDQHNEVLETSNHQRCKLIKLKSGLMHDLLTGRVRVTLEQAATT